MILFKNKPISIAQENCIMLELENGEDPDNSNFVYLSKSTYDQALLLSDRFEGECTYLNEKINGKDRSMIVNDHTIDYFFKNAPEPINILAPYLGLIDFKLDEDLEQLCGALHMLSMTIDFNEFSKVPDTVRANVRFSRSTIKRYKQNWKDIEMKLNVKDVDLENVSVEAVAIILSKILPSLNLAMPAVNTQVAYAQQYQPQNVQAAVEEEEAEDELEDEASVYAGMTFDEMIAYEMKQSQKEEEEKQKSQETVEVTAETSSEPENEADKEKNEIESFIGLLVGGGA
jgi:hypothetical protein